jgi:Cof subfamily protein (haloacid dehalogenase superfamily)
MTTHPIPYRLLAFDYDGTLASDGGSITPRTRRALKLAHDQGCTLALITGRSKYTVPPVVFRQPFTYLATANGARIDNLETRQLISQSPLSRELAFELLDIFDPEDVSYTAFLNGRLYFETRSLEFLRKRSNISFIKKVKSFWEFVTQVKIADNIRRVLQDSSEPIEKLICTYQDPARCARMLERMQARTDLEAVTTSGNDIEFTARGVNKGTAITHLMTRLAIPREQVLAFGDSGNDLAMIETAGCFMAPEDASPDVLEKAHQIIPSPLNDGVAVALEGMFG